MTTATLHRILVALDASPHSDAALQEAAALAAPLQAELAGIFVLDSELLRLSALPAASETGLTSAQRRPLTPETMERALRLQADRARKSLEATARRYHLASSFQLIHGNVLAEILRAAKDTDLLAMGVVGQMNVTRSRFGSTVRGVTTGASCSLLLLSPGVRRGNRVVAVFGASTQADRALDLARQLADQRDTELVVLIDATGGSAEALQTAARTQLEAAGSEARFEVLATDEIPALKAALQRYAGGLLVIAADCGLIEGQQDQLSSLEIPVLLARQATD
jgi:nucleotide-binding universal stress UspA family protein